MAVAQGLLGFRAASVQPLLVKPRKTESHENQIESLVSSCGIGHITRSEAHMEIFLFGRPNKTPSNRQAPGLQD